MVAEWHECRWGDIATLEYGKRLQLQGYENDAGSYPVYGTNGLIGRHSEPLCPNPGVIIGRKGAYRGVHYSDKPFFVIDTAFYLKPKVNIDLKWAYYQLLTQNINSMDSGSAIPSTSRDAFYNLPVKVPPLPEQKAIASILGTLDDKIELNRKMNETLEAMARAIFKSWFVDFDPIPGLGTNKEWQDSPLGRIPKGWRVGTLDEICEIVMGQSPHGETYNETEEGLPFYQGIRDFSFRFPTKRVFCTAPTRIAHPGDVLLSVRAPVGSLNIANEDCAIGRGVATLRTGIQHYGFLYYLMKETQWEWEKFEAKGTVFGAATKTDVQNFSIILPPSRVISCYNEKVFSIDQVINNNELQSHTLTTIRNALLPKLLSGEIRVKDVESFEEIQP